MEFDPRRIVARMPFPFAQLPFTTRGLLCVQYDAASQGRRRWLTHSSLEKDKLTFGSS